MGFGPDENERSRPLFLLSSMSAAEPEAPIKMIEYRMLSFAERDHHAKGDAWGEWHINGDKIQRCLFDAEEFLLATETLEGDVAALVAFAKTGGDLTAYEADMARKLERLHRRQTQQLLRAMRSR